MSVSEAFRPIDAPVVNGFDVKIGEAADGSGPVVLVELDPTGLLGTLSAAFDDPAFMRKAAMVLLEGSERLEGAQAKAAREAAQEAAPSVAANSLHQALDLLGNVQPEDAGAHAKHNIETAKVRIESALEALA